MPIYEYQCKKCGHRFERMQKMSDPHPTGCPDCGAKKSVEQLMSAPAVQFKGSGWYVTDYAKKSSAPTSETKTEVKADSGGEKKTESKTDKKTETKSEKKSGSSEKK